MEGGERRGKGVWYIVGTVVGKMCLFNTRLEVRRNGGENNFVIVLPLPLLSTSNLSGNQRVVFECYTLTSFTIEVFLGRA